MPKKIKYTGGSDVRHISAADFEKNGVTDAEGDLTLDRGNNFEAVVPDGVAELLLKDREFTDITDEPSTADQTEGTGAGNGAAEYPVRPAAL